MSDTVISVENLSKLYLLGQAERRHESLLSELGGLLSAPFRNFRELRRLDTSRAGGDGQAESPDLLRALKEVSFEVKRGDVLGIIGSNGAGKSTLLKILSRITEPTRGRVRIQGRVASLLEVGTGFHPDLSGRENVYLNGTILGMKRREIDRQFDEIVEFSGIERFLDTPVKRYSSGMKVRLGFAVAAHLPNDILIVDEVLAVGDAEFQRKCVSRIQAITGQQDRTILFVSHGMGVIRTLCTTGIWLKKGQLVAAGPAEDIVQAYTEETAQRAVEGVAEREDRGGDGDARMVAIHLAGLDGRPVGEVKSGDNCSFVFEYNASRPLRNPAVLFTIYNSSGESMIHASSNFSPTRPDGEAGQHEIRCQLNRLPLAPGSYHVNVAITDSAGMLDHLVSAFRFDVVWGDFYGIGEHYHMPNTSVLADSTWDFALQPR